MRGRMYYYNFGGGGPPINPLAWIVGIAIAIGLGILLLPVVGFFVLGLVLFSVAAVLAGKVMRWLGKSGSQSEEFGTGGVDAPEPGGQERPEAAGSRNLEIQEAVVVEEIERKTRAEATRGTQKRLE